MSGGVMQLLGICMLLTVVWLFLSANSVHGSRAEGGRENLFNGPARIHDLNPDAPISLPDSGEDSQFANSEEIQPSVDTWNPANMRNFMDGLPLRTRYLERVRNPEAASLAGRQDFVEELLSNPAGWTKPVHYRWPE